MKHDLLKEIRQAEKQAAKMIEAAEEKGQKQLAEVALMHEKEAVKLAEERENVMAETRERAREEALKEARKIKADAKSQAESLRRKAAPKIDKAAEYTRKRVQELWEPQE